ncbi:hypothetical protein DICPUDRAFT_84943 [Dictyostelium purpureum]|uniref:Large ribosomal subunit protein uL15/eL18 domain-containing protein n=1 Tax=Dictyostelium purpureum TaxID=5786 RepID=F1A478_DICPU|nr:uncharacterized protein DICPUDRAFT_84943 [Dictyostelium purpureum]EGC29003.1 hypothetical protein DICPUDRAFT_84943 [Dictyostelium purpureum]|eukprot:XP_003294473.1 hypothetical protein DICPUDRAFT_84943 [Dictyostelium purpureum]
MLSNLVKSFNKINISNTSTIGSVRTIIYTNPNEVSLNNLRDNPGATKTKIRLGRGMGSNKGKTSGRGHGGQKARAGHNIPRAFEGGQTPLFKKMRKYGFSNSKFERVYNPVNFNTLNRLITEGKINPNETITMKHLFDLNVTGSISHGIKLLSDGKEYFKHKINIELTDFSKAAKETIENLGGTAQPVYYDRVGLRYLLKPEKFDFTPKRARVPLKLKDKFPDHVTGYMGAFSTVGGLKAIDTEAEESN